MKSWNIRDQTTEALEDLLRQKYKEIRSNAKAANMAATIEDARYYIEAKFRARSFATDIELELLRRRMDNEQKE